jgi:hypothetical protein
MSRYKLSLHTAYTLVKSRRPEVNPNPLFWTLLKQFEQELLQNTQQPQHQQTQQPQSQQQQQKQQQQLQQQGQPCQKCAQNKTDNYYSSYSVANDQNSFRRAKSMNPNVQDSYQVSRPTSMYYTQQYQQQAKQVPYSTRSYYG